MDETNADLMNKKLDDLTVADALKINLVVVAVTIAIPVVIGSAFAAKEAVQTRVRARKAQKAVTTPTI